MSNYTLLEDEAEEIMEKRFFGTKKWEEIFGQKVDNSYCPAPIPWGRGILTKNCSFYPTKRIYETHILFLALPIVVYKNTAKVVTILEWKNILLEHDCYMFDAIKKNNVWYRDKAFANLPIGYYPRWYLMLAEPGGSVINPLSIANYDIPSPLVEVLKLSLLILNGFKISNQYRFCSDNIFVSPKNILEVGASCSLTRSVMRIPGQ